MSPLRLVTVSGSTGVPSRTAGLVAAIAAEVARRRPVEVRAITLAEIGPGLGAFSREALPLAGQAALAAIEGADALIVGTPIHKGSYSGLFKHLFDFVAPEALAGVPVVLAATGGGRRHALAVEHQLRPLFGFFGALALPTSVYAGAEDFSDGVLSDPTTLARIDAAAQELATFARAGRAAAALGRVA